MNHFFKRLHSDAEVELFDKASETLEELDNSEAIESFNSLGITAFESTFRALFEQANSQATRLTKIRSILEALEDELLTRDALAEMNQAEKLTLFRDLMVQSNVLTRGLLSLARPFGSLRIIIATLDSLREYKKAELLDGASETLEELDNSEAIDV